MTTHSIPGEPGLDEWMPDEQDATVLRLTRRDLLQRGAMLAGALGFGEMLREPNAVEVTRHTVAMPSLREPVRVAQLTDLHRSWCVSEGFLDRVVELTNAEKPHVVALTGDYVTGHSDYAESCARSIARLNAPQGMFAVLGNHDYKADGWRGAPIISASLREAGARVLTNANLRLDCGLRVVGVDDSFVGHPDPELAYYGVEKNEPTLTLTHNPAAFALVLRGRAGVTLAGHIHGGQINIPGVTNSFLGAYIAGWYGMSGMPGRMYVSRGLGVVFAPWRFRAAPEIAIFDLVPA